MDSPHQSKNFNNNIQSSLISINPINIYTRSSIFNRHSGKKESITNFKLKRRQSNFNKSGSSSSSNVSCITNNKLVNSFGS